MTIKNMIPSNPRTNALQVAKLMRRLEDCSPTGKRHTKASLYAELYESLTIELFGDFLPNTQDDEPAALHALSTDARELVVSSNREYSVMNVGSYGYLEPEDVVNSKRSNGWYTLPDRMLLTGLKLAAQKNIQVIKLFKEMIEGGQVNLYSPLGDAFENMDHELVGITEDCRIVSFRTEVSKDRYVASFAEVEEWGVMSDHPLKFFKPGEGSKVVEPKSALIIKALTGELDVPEIVLFAVGAGQKHGLSFEGEVPWGTKDIVEFFKEETKGQLVVMGRKAFETHRGQFKGSAMICVLTRQAVNDTRGAAWFNSAEDILAIRGPKSIYVVGGQEIYEEFMPHASRVLLGMIEGNYYDSMVHYDKHFPSYALGDSFQEEPADRKFIAGQEGRPDFSVNTYVRVVPTPK